MSAPGSFGQQVFDLDILHPTESAFDHVRQQLQSLTGLLDLKKVRDKVFGAYDSICNTSLNFPLGERPRWFSRINADGTPFQYSVTLGVPFGSLQFLGEVGCPCDSAVERMQDAYTCLADVAEIFNADTELEVMESLLSHLMPVEDPRLATDSAGAFWVGTAFVPNREPQLRVYCNGRWGSEADQWCRFRYLASYFGMTDSWIKAEKLLQPETMPLGFALTLSRGANVTGRIYVSAYGKLLDYYEELARAVSGDRFARMLRQYSDCLLGPDRAYPTPTAVCSLGLTGGRPLDFKFELCTHCLFANDVEASDRLNRCFSEADINVTDYQQLLEVLSGGSLDNRSLRLHCYSGVGVKQGKVYYPVYLKPKLIEV